MWGKSAEYKMEPPQPRDVELGQTTGPGDGAESRQRRVYGRTREQQSFQTNPPDEAAEELDFDPVSLKEPENLHSWDWLSKPFRCILHKTVLEVDGRDQHCAFILWLLIVLVFLVYGALVFYGPILQRRTPPQAFSFSKDPKDLQALQHLPWFMICPSINYASADARFPVDLGVVSRGWVSQMDKVGDRGVLDDRGLHRAHFSEFEVIPKHAPNCSIKRCYYFDGPSYSASPDASVPLEQRWITFFINLRTPLDGSEKAWSAMSALVYAGVEDPDTACLSDHIRPFTSSVLLTRRTPERRQFRADRIRLKFYNNFILDKEHYSPGEERGFSDPFFEMVSVGSDMINRMTNATMDADVPGMATFAGGVSFRVAPFVIMYKELEPVDVLALLGTIAGAFGVFVLAFKLTFPAGSSGRRRIRRFLRPCITRTVPPAKSRTLEDFEHQVLGSAQLDTSETKAEAAQDDEEAGGGSRERRRSSTTSWPLGFSFRKRNRSGSSSHPSSHYDEVVNLELPGPEERLLVLEHMMRVLVRELRRLRRAEHEREQQQQQRQQQQREQEPLQRLPEEESASAGRLRTEEGPDDPHRGLRQGQQ